MKTRDFEKINAYKDVEFNMPERKTESSAGYDFSLPKEVTFAPGVVTFAPTGVKAYMPQNEFLGLHIRSSIAAKKGLFLVNNVGIVDADYYNNDENEGHIMLAIINTTDKPVILEKNERIAQGIFYEYKVTDSDDKQQKEQRKGGFGSTSK